MAPLIRYSALILAPALIYSACDNRGNVDRTKPTPSFSVEMTAVRDYSQHRSVADISFQRDNQPFDGASIKIGNITIPSAGSGRYFAQSPQLILFSRLNEITLSSPEDDYLKTLTFDLPDSFSITSIIPQYNQGAVPVDIDWSSAGGAAHYILIVMAKHYPANGTSPLRLLLGTDSTAFLIPDTTFEDATADIISDTYYIYLAAFNQGFGPYLGLTYPLPDSLPQRRVADPAGFLRYGTVAPIDSIIVPL